MSAAGAKLPELYNRIHALRADHNEFAVRGQEALADDIAFDILVATLAARDILQEWYA